MIKINRQEFYKKLNTLDNEEKIQDIKKIVNQTKKGYLIEYKDIIDNVNELQFVIDLEELKNELEYLIEYVDWFTVDKVYELEF